jgi:MoxR-like ATPase
VVLVFLLMALPAAAQRPGCGLGQGLAALDAAERAMAGAARATALLPLRDAAGRATSRLEEAARILAGCGCRRMAEQAAEGAGIAAGAVPASDPATIRRLLERARFSGDQARTIRDREACG